VPPCTSTCQQPARIAVPLVASLQVLLPPPRSRPRLQAAGHDVCPIARSAPLPLWRNRSHANSTYPRTHIHRACYPEYDGPQRGAPASSASSRMTMMRSLTNGFAEHGQARAGEARAPSYNRGQLHPTPIAALLHTLRGHPHHFRTAHQTQGPPVVFQLVQDKRRPRDRVSAKAPLMPSCCCPPVHFVHHQRPPVAATVSQACLGPNSDVTGLTNWQLTRPHQSRRTEQSAATIVLSCPCRREWGGGGEISGAELNVADQVFQGEAAGGSHLIRGPSAFAHRCIAVNNAPRCGGQNIKTPECAGSNIATVASRREAFEAVKDPPARPSGRRGSDRAASG